MTVNPASALPPRVLLQLRLRLRRQCIDVNRDFGRIKNTLQVWLWSDTDLGAPDSCWLIKLVLERQFNWPWPRY